MGLYLQNKFLSLIGPQNCIEGQLSNGISKQNQDTRIKTFGERLINQCGKKCMVGGFSLTAGVSIIVLKTALTGKVYQAIFFATGYSVFGVLVVGLIVAGKVYYRFKPFLKKVCGALEQKKGELQEQLDKNLEALKAKMTEVISPFQINSRLLEVFSMNEEELNKVKTMEEHITNSKQDLLKLQVNLIQLKKDLKQEIKWTENISIYSPNDIALKIFQKETEKESFLPEFVLQNTKEWLLNTQGVKDACKNNKDAQSKSLENHKKVCSAMLKEISLLLTDLGKIKRAYMEITDTWNEVVQEESLCVSGKVSSYVTNLVNRSTEKQTRVDEENRKKIQSSRNYKVITQAIFGVCTIATQVTQKIQEFANRIELYIKDKDLTHLEYSIETGEGVKQAEKLAKRVKEYQVEIKERKKQTYFQQLKVQAEELAKKVKEYQVEERKSQTYFQQLCQVFQADPLLEAQGAEGEEEPLPTLSEEFQKLVGEITSHQDLAIVVIKAAKDGRGKIDPSKNSIYSQKISECLKRFVEGVGDIHSKEHFQKKGMAALLFIQQAIEEGRS